MYGMPIYFTLYSEQFQVKVETPLTYHKDDMCFHFNSSFHLDFHLLLRVCMDISGIPSNAQ